MLTPAINAYGLPVVIVLLVFLLGGVVTLIADYRRWSGHRRTEVNAAVKRHPAGRHRAPAAPTPTPARDSFVRSMHRAHWRHP